MNANTINGDFIINYFVFLFVIFVALTPKIIRVGCVNLHHFVFEMKPETVKSLIKPR